MGASKKDLRNKKNKVLEAQGLRPEITASGVPAKPKKATCICTVCKIELSHVNQMKDHALSKHPKHTAEQCFPDMPK